jgi:hypothetical protein
MLRKERNTDLYKNSLLVGILVIIISCSLPIPSVQAQGVIEETVARRDLMLNLGEGLTTDARYGNWRACKTFSPDS